MSEPKVLVGIPSIGTIDPMFLACAMELRRPPGTKVAIPSRVVTDQARNSVVEYALNEKFTHVLFIADDVLFPPSLLELLLAHSLAHPALAGIAGMVYARHHPHHPCAFTRKPNTPLFIPVKPEGEGVLKVDAIATAAAIFPVWAFEKVGFPWFEYLYIGNNRFTEDIAFCLKLNDMGFKFGVDLDLNLGHLGDRVPVKKATYLEACKPSIENPKILAP